MAFDVNGLEGNELADDYIRKHVPQSRWGDTWDVFKSNFWKFVLINVFTLIFFVPAIVVMYFRGSYIQGLGMTYPFNPSIIYPFYPDVQGLNESVTLSADILFYSLLIVAGFVAALGVAGAAYSVRKLINTHGDFTVKSYFHGIKVCFTGTILPITVFLIFLFATVLIGDWKDLIYAVGGNRAGAVCAEVFIYIALVLIGIYCGWLLAVGTNYKVKFIQLLKSSFVLAVGNILPTVFMAALALVPVWLFLSGGIVRWIAGALFIFFGFSYIMLIWTAFTQWAFDRYVDPGIKAAAEQAKSQKSEKELANDRLEDDRRTARELLAAGRSELIARPIMPIAADAVVKVPSLTFTREDISGADKSREKLYSDISAYEKAHENDPVYAEYNKLFAEREKVLQSNDKKGKKSKKISSDNLLK